MSKKETRTRTRSNGHLPIGGGLEAHNLPLCYSDKLLDGFRMLEGNLDSGYERREEIRPWSRDQDF